MSYALVENRNILAVSGEIPENADPNDVWLPIEDPGAPVYPEYDPNTQRAEMSIVFEEDKVSVVYTIVDREKPLEEQIDALASVLVSKGVISSGDVADFKRPKPPRPAI